MALKGKGKELRRCKAYTLEGLGNQCKAWAKYQTNYCNMHSPPAVIDDGERELRRMLPLAYPKKKTKFRCRCSAYSFPHRYGAGLCNFPHPPTHRLVLDEMAMSLLHKAHREDIRLKTILRNSGIRNGKTNCIKRIRAGRVVPIKPEDLKPEDFTLLEDYLKDYVELEDWSSLPIEEKRKRIKEQMIEALSKQYGFKQCLKREYPNIVRVESEKRDDEGFCSEELHYKIVKETRVSERNGEIREIGYMILETGEKIPLE